MGLPVGEQNTDVEQNESEDEADKTEHGKVQNQEQEESEVEMDAEMEEDNDLQPQVGISSPSLSPLPSAELRNGNGPHESTETMQDVKITVDRGIASSLPALTQSVISAAKHATRVSRSFASKFPHSPESSWLRSPDRMKIMDTVLRSGGAGLSLIAFSVMVATNETRTGAGSTFKMTFTDFRAYNYLVALNLISFLYSSGQLYILGQSRRNNAFSSPFKQGLFVYICDQVLAYLLFSASSAAATASELSHHGLRNIWPPACSTWKLWLFCSKADGAVTMSFFSSFFVILSSLFSGYYLSTLLTE